MFDIQGLRDWLRSAVANWFERPMVSAFAAVGISANVATLLGVAIAGVAAYFAAMGDFWIAGVLVIVGSAMDLVDGGLARRSGTVSKRGAILDSVLDRVSETLVFVGLIIYFTDSDTASQTDAILIVIALAGSLMVSYVRARAEGLGLRGKAGFFTRPERVALTGILLIADQPTILLWILAVGTPLSAAMRFIDVWGNADQPLD
ncbi:MAG: CDP-alcohol phosphatidyltransferase family protein [Chloroflexi bacterium]|nr:CDP-alcohol phosphatidyltransferase family protein [Chloroflexota bacterium]